MEGLNLLTYLGLFFLISQIFGKLANLVKAPHLVGYLIAGILFGPYVLHIFSEEIVGQMDLFTDMALAIIAFSIGASLKLEKIKKNKKIIFGIAIFQAILCSLVVAGSLFAFLYYYFPFEVVEEIIAVCILIGALSAASAPATILSIIHEYRAQGHITNILLGITAISDVITLIFYAFAFTMAETLVTNAAFDAQSGFIDPLLSVIYATSLGLIIGIVIKIILKYFPKKEVLLGLILGAVFLLAGLAEMFEFSHLLPIMVFGFFIENFADGELAKKSYEAVDHIEEPIFGVFFLLAGAHLDLQQASSAGFVVMVVFLARGLSKYAGTRLTAELFNARENVKKYAGLALIPSAGVAIGLILDAQNELAEHIPSLATLMLSIVLGKALINELVSPFLVKFVLKKSGEIRFHD